MNLINRIAQTFRGARRIELLIVIALAAAVGLLLIGGSDGGNVAQTDLETRMADVLSAIDGAGEVNVMISADAGGNITGVLVVAEGADDISVYIRLQSAVKALVDVDASRIEIIKMEDD